MKIEELIKFIDENVIRNAQSAEHLKSSIEKVRDFLYLKGPIDEDIKNYLDLLIEGAEEIVSLKNKGIFLSSVSFFSESTRRRKEKEAEEASHSRHYSSGC